MGNMADAAEILKKASEQQARQTASARVVVTSTATNKNPPVYNLTTSAGKTIAMMEDTVESSSRVVIAETSSNL